MRKTVRSVISGLVATAAAVTMSATLGATPAQAGTARTVNTVAGNGFVAIAGSAHFYDLGDKFTLYDEESDGAGVYLYWSINQVDQPGIYWGGCFNTSKTFDQEIAEGAIVHMKVCLRDGGVIQTATCSKWVSAVA